MGFAGLCNGIVYRDIRLDTWAQEIFYFLTSSITCWRIRVHGVPEEATKLVIPLADITVLTLTKNKPADGPVGMVQICP